MIVWGSILARVNERPPLVLRGLGPFVLAQVPDLLQILRQRSSERFRKQQVEESAGHAAAAEDDHDDPRILLSLRNY